MPTHQLDWIGDWGMYGIRADVICREQDTLHGGGVVVFDEWEVTVIAKTAGCTSRTRRRQ